MPRRDRLLLAFMFVSVPWAMAEPFLHTDPSSTTSSPCFSTPKGEENSEPSNDIVVVYFKNFELLARSEAWPEIMAQGSVALEVAENSQRRSEAAKICAQLTSTAFYMGDYDQALLYATYCHELAEEVKDLSLLLRALYLESAVYRALAPKAEEEQLAQGSYLRAVEIGEQAAHLYSTLGVHDLGLKGKIYFNLGAAHADNPMGNLEKAKTCYLIATECFKNVKATPDWIRTSIRLGKVDLLQNNYDHCQQILEAIRPCIESQRLSMQADYLEAQLKWALHDFEEARRIAKIGLEKAQFLQAKEDEARFQSLLQKIDRK